MVATRQPVFFPEFSAIVEVLRAQQLNSQIQPVNGYAMLKPTVQLGSYNDMELKLGWAWEVICAITCVLIKH